MVINSIKIILISTLFTTVALCASATHFNVIDGNQEEKYEKEFLPTLEDVTGFILTDPHEKIDDVYEQRYGNPKSPDYDKDWKKNLDNLGFFLVSNDVALHDILIKSPQAAAFQPFNLLIYKKVSEDKTYIGHLDPSVMLDIAGVKDKDSREAYIKMFKPLDTYVTKEFGGKIITTEYNTKLPVKPMMTFEFEVDRSEDISEWVEGFQEEFEDALEGKGYVIAGFKNYKESYEDLEMPFKKYDEFFVYALCHFTFSYNIFNKGYPQAGVFAPCAMYFYIEKDSNKMIVGMPRLSIWQIVMGIQESELEEQIKKIDCEIVNIMQGLGAKEI